MNDEDRRYFSKHDASNIHKVERNDGTVVSRVNDSIILPNRKRFFQPAQPVYHFVELSFCRIEKYKILGQSGT